MSHRRMQVWVLTAALVASGAFVGAGRGESPSKAEKKAGAQSQRGHRVEREFGVCELVSIDLILEGCDQAKGGENWKFHHPGLSIPNGHTAVLSGWKIEEKGQSRCLLVLVTPKIIEKEAK